ncbi:MAG: transcription termination/antitermination protein NusA, partial [Chloroflexi bacterium]|nr:transcription termination/antitermination protein NusA [Chloroflexota bacterium]
MKSDFLIAITQLSAEKKLPKEVIMEAVESALVSAYKKENPLVLAPVTVKLHPGTGEFKVFVEKMVVGKATDPLQEISLADARKLKKDIKEGETAPVEVSLPKSAGRIAAQTAKQVVLQRLREAERDAIYEEYATKQGDVVSGIIQRIESNKNIFMELGRTEALMPPSEQVRVERYRVGQRVRAYVLEVARSGRGPQVIVSRTHPNLLKRLFELEVPETHNGTVEIKSIAREPGQRSKVAVSARQAGIDPVGSCVGQRGIRIQNIVSELNGEKIDVVLWDPNPATFIANALSPAQVLHVEINAGLKAATVVVPDRQLSLAIGKEGQNARLAAKLTGWKIDIKSAVA